MGLAAAGAAPSRSPRRAPDSTRDATELLARWTAEGLTATRPVVSQSLTEAHAAVPANDESSTEIPVVAMNTQIAEAAPADKPRRQQSASEPLGNWVAVGGQMAAYMGVLLLTCGTALVVVSQFGGTMQQAITGWLLTTVGQMLLFVGVVTLVSHGLEQNRRDIARQMRRFRKLLRDSQAANEAASERRAA